LIKTEYEKYREKQLQNPEFKAKYYLAKEKLKIDFLIDSIDEAISNQNSLTTIKRRTAKLRKHIAGLTI
jgi:hypothetical protein